MSKTPGVAVLDDYQNAVRKLRCAAKLEQLNAKVFTNTVKGIGQLSIRLRDADVLVLIRERTHFPRQLLEKLPRLKLIAQIRREGTESDSPAHLAAAFAGSALLFGISATQFLESYRKRHGLSVA